MLKLHGLSLSAYFILVFFLVCFLITGQVAMVGREPGEDYLIWKTAM